MRNISNFSTAVALFLLGTLRFHAVQSFSFPVGVRSGSHASKTRQTFVATDSIGSRQHKLAEFERTRKSVRVSSQLDSVLNDNLMTPSTDEDNGEKLHPGNVMIQRYLYRFSPTKSTIQTPYTIEERQNHIVGEDGYSLEPIGDKSIIFRGGGASSSPNEDDFDGNFAKIDPALYAVEGLKGENDVDNNTGFGNDSELEWSHYAMALYCMEHPEFFKGRGLEVGR
jgi:hypothetical protein